MSAAFTVENLSKCYRIRHDGEGGHQSRSFREALTEGVRSVFSRKGSASRSPSTEEFWALRDISFSISQGEVVGIVGRNGAGKSTLLKILSRITEPTQGSVRIRGRVASLLEVGTGFHPELSGRENIFLNGAILGMYRDEIRRKFDEIVAFSEIEKFLDTPVKRYSSGMYVRLAFAVAAHLEPEILIVDEVLAVGDAQFQKKCLGKMKDVAGHGRTVIFVSHNMAAVRALCTRAILLRDGQLHRDGDPGEVTAVYLAGGEDAQSSRDWRATGDAPGNDDIRLEYLKVTPPDGEEVITVDTGAIVELGFVNHRPNINLDATFYVTTADGVILFEAGCILSCKEDAKTGSHRIRWELPPHFLNCGRFGLNILFGRDQHYVVFQANEVVSFQVENSVAHRGRNMNVPPGPVRPLIPWDVQLPGEPLVRNFRLNPTAD